MIEDLSHLPATTDNLIFQKPSSKVGGNDFEGAADDELTAKNYKEAREREGSSDREREGSQVYTTLGKYSRVLSFLTSTSENPTESYLRLINPTSNTQTVYILVYGLNEARTYLVSKGRCRVDVPAKASPQLSAKYFENCVGWEPSDNDESMILDFDIGLNLYWQNIVWSPQTGYFGNLSTCREPTVNDSFVHNVHTTRISAYPSTLIGLIGVGEEYRVKITLWHSGTGRLVGEYESQLYSKDTGTIGLPLSSIEEDTDWKIPFSERPYQVNLELNLINKYGSTITEGWADLVSHNVYQTFRNESYNMLNACVY